MRERQFLVTHPEETFQVGRLDGDSFSGVYLSPAYMYRLREVLYAASLRLDTQGDSPIPDALENLFGIVQRLTQVHGAQLKLEGYPWTAADHAALADAEKQLKAAYDALRGFPTNDDPDDA